MAQVDATSFDAALKEYYTDETVKDLVYKDHPWFAMVPKKSDLSGDKYVVPLTYGIPGSRSASLAIAIQNKDTGKHKKFEVTTVDDYAAISIGRKVMKQSANDRGAFFEARTKEIDLMLEALTRSIATSLYRNGGGALGRISSGQGGVTITLSEPEDVVNFEVGMEVQFSTADGTSGAVKAGTATITGIDADAGTITSDSAFSAQCATIAASDYIFAQGDFGAKISGLAAWIPTSAPSATAFFGVDRSVHATRLGGVRLSCANDPVTEALRKGISRLGREGQSPDIALMSYAKHRDLCLELENKAELVEQGATATVGFTGIKFVGGKRPVIVFPDADCPDAQCYLLTKSSWKLVSLGPVPDLHDDDGIRMLRESTSDGYEVRASYYANLACDAPGANCVLTLE